MQLIPQLPQAAADLALLDALILQTAEATNHLAATMSRCNSAFWSLPDDRLVAVLTLVIRRASGFESETMALTPARQASSATVPDPPNGSNICESWPIIDLQPRKKCGICGITFAG